MQFSPFGNQDDIKPQVTDHPGFSHGLIEGMLVRRGIDRQNQTDKLNESYNKKMMDMQEQEARDKVLHASLLAQKMQKENEIQDQFGIPNAQADLEAAQKKPGYMDAQTANLTSQTTERGLNGPLDRAKTVEETYNLRDMTRSRRAKDNQTSMLGFEPDELDLAISKRPELIQSLSKKEVSLRLARQAKMGTDMSSFQSPSEIADIKNKNKEAVKGQINSATLTTLSDELQGLQGAYDAMPKQWTGQIGGRLGSVLKREETDPAISSFNTKSKALGVRWGKLIEGGRFSDQDRLFYLSLVPNRNQTPDVVKQNIAVMKEIMKNDDFKNKIFTTEGNPTLQKPDNDPHGLFTD